MNNNAMEKNSGDELPGATSLRAASAEAAATETAGAQEESAERSARAAVRVLIVAQFAGAKDAALRAAAGLDPMPPLRGVLEAANYIVSAAPPAQWQPAVGALRPSLVVLEASTPIEESAAICRAMKSESAIRPLLVILPGKDEAAEEAQWSALRAAGADDFITATASRDALEARVSLLARLSVALRENQEMQEHLARHMQIDETTQLLNRRFFFQSAQRECSRARRYGHALSCLMVDIEYLDDVARMFGYGCVEYVLRAVAYAVRQWTRDSDVIGRFNERKFVVLLPETDIEGAVAVREKILNAISESQYSWEGRDIPISVSIGEAERRYERLYGEGSTPAAEEETGDETALDESGPGPLSVREELASLLEDADAALNVARRSSLRPNIFVQYTPGEA
jgi:diguanylate cyclase (GGDEF)-like protein